MLHRRQVVRVSEVRMHRLRGLEIVLAVVFAGAAELEVWRYDGADRAALACLALGTTLPLAGSRRWPLGAHAAIVASVAGMALVEPAFEPIVALFAVILSMANVGRRERIGPAFAAGTSTAAVFALAITRDPSDSIANVAPTVLLFVALPLVAGIAIGRRHERAERLAQEVGLAAGRERERIARELHDVVSHGVTAMVVQAQAGQRLVESDPGRARDAFVAIEDSGRSALTELRRLLTLLHSDREDHGPQPGLDDIAELATTVRALGVDVEVRVDGDPVALPLGVDVSAYRVVQEALMNVVKHARGARATVLVLYVPSGLELEVRDDGGTGSTVRGAGLGLHGLRQRVELLGGTLEAEHAGAGFVVRAVLPA